MPESGTPRSEVHGREHEQAPDDSYGGSIGIIDILALFVMMTSVSSMALLVMDSFQPLLAGLTGLGLSTVALLALRVRVRWIRPQRVLISAVGLITGAIARSDLFPHLIGGQDEGLYTNMAIQIKRSGSLVYTDTFRASLTGALRNAYDRYLISGTELLDSSQSTFTINFYPMHPIWMALFGAVLGDARQTLSLVFFAWFGAVMAMSIGRVLAPGSIAPWLIALFVAVNPALAFFSKFPVAEMVGSAFALAGFNYMARAALDTVRSRQAVFALISVGSFFSLCFVRFQMFVYLPFLALLLLLALTRYVPRRSGFVLCSIVCAAVVGLMISLIFYKSQQSTLYEVAMQSIAPHVSLASAIAGLILLAGLVSVHWYIGHRRGPEAVTSGIDRMLNWSPQLFLLTLAASVPSIVSLYQDGDLTPWTYAPLSTSDPWLIRYSALWRLMLFVSPVALATVCGAAFWRNRPRLVNAAILLLCVCWSAVLLQPYVPYLYYYGRYLISDVVPIVLILTAVILANAHARGRRALVYTAAGIVTIFGLVATVPQIGHREGEDPSFNQSLAELLDATDVIVFPMQDDRYLLPLRIAYDQHVLVVPSTPEDALSTESQLLEEAYATAAKDGGRLFVARLSPADMPGWRLVTSITFAMYNFSNEEHWRDDTFQSKTPSNMFLPIDNDRRSQEWQIYEVDSLAFEDLS